MWITVVGYKDLNHSLHGSNACSAHLFPKSSKSKVPLSTTSVSYPPMIRNTLLPWRTGRGLLQSSPSIHQYFFSSSAPANATGCHKNNPPTPVKSATPWSTWQLGFWTCRATWKRAGTNTLRCLVGCTTGDFSALWLLQTYYPELGMGSIMAASSKSFHLSFTSIRSSWGSNDSNAVASGITTSIIMESIFLRRGPDRLSWPMAVRTAMGMSMVSMLAMETAENLVDYHLTGGVVDVDDPKFWMAAAVSMTAGYLAPFPYNYLRLRKYGNACH